MKYIYALLIIVFFSCKKATNSIVQPQEQQYILTYSCYGEQIPYLLCYETKQHPAPNYVLDTIKTHSYSVQVEITEEQFSYSIGVSNIIEHTNDSLFIRAERNGKFVEHGFRFKGGMANITTQIYPLK